MGTYDSLLKEPAKKTPSITPKAVKRQSPPPLQKVVKKTLSKANKRQIKKSRGYRGTTIPRNHGTKKPYNQDLIESIRKAVKGLGKEAATYRFTAEEKKSLADIVYQYRGQKIRTSENEITRIAINNLVEDYRQNGKNSVLARVINSLNA